MAKNRNNKTVYIYDHNLPKWESVNKSDFVNWCLKHKISEYKKAKSITANYNGVTTTN